VIGACLQFGQQCVLEGFKALAVFGAERQHGLVEGCAQALGLDAHPEACRLISHVQGQHGRQTELLHLQG